MIMTRTIRLTLLSRFLADWRITRDCIWDEFCMVNSHDEPKSSDIVILLTFFICQMMETDVMRMIPKGRKKPRTSKYRLYGKVSGLSQDGAQLEWNRGNCL